MQKRPAGHTYVFGKVRIPVSIPEIVIFWHSSASSEKKTKENCCIVFFLLCSTILFNPKNHNENNVLIEKVRADFK